MNDETETKKSILFGGARTWLRGKDAAIGKTIDNAVERYLAKRREYVESLPEVTRDELASEGLLDAPPIRVPASAMSGVGRRR